MKLGPHGPTTRRLLSSSVKDKDNIAIQVNAIMWEPFEVLKMKAGCFLYCRDQSFEQLIQRLDFFITLLAIAGASSLIYLLYNIFNFLYLHFFRPSSISRYTHPAQGPRVATRYNDGRTWALITGASDGIGKGFAEEWCSRDSHIILHGRNAAKLNKVKAALNAQWPNIQIKLAVIDAGDAKMVEKIEDLAREVVDLPIKVLINNVGGSGPVRPTWRELQRRTREEIDLLIDVNLRFSTHLTRVMLPILLRNKSSLILNVGSVAALIPSPWLTVYAGSKAFNLAWSRSLTAEMRATGEDVEVLGIIVGEVQAQHNSTRDTGLFRPSSRTMARAALGMVGCGKAVVTPYVGHALQMAMVGILPESLLNWLSIRVLEATKAKYEKGE